MYRSYLLTSVALGAGLTTGFYAGDMRAQTCPTYTVTPTCTGSVCKINMTSSSYTLLCAGTGSTICATSIQAAMSDQQSYFASNTAVQSGTLACAYKNKSLEIVFPAGSFDLSNNGTTGHSDPSTGSPVLMTLSNGLEEPISDTERLIITGTSPGTTLTTNYTWETVYGISMTDNSNGFSHFTLENMTFARNGATTSQGTLTAVTLPLVEGATGAITFVVQNSPSGAVDGVASGVQPPNGISNPDYPNPFPIGFNSPAFGVSGTDGKYLRIYDNTGGVPTLDPGLSNGNTLCSIIVGTTTTSFCNNQITWDTCTDPTTASCYYTDPMHNDNGYGTYSVVTHQGGLSWGDFLGSMLWYRDLLSAGNKNPSGTPVIVCVKSAGAAADFGYFDDSATGGSDIILSGLTIKDHTHTSFFGVHGNLTTGDPGVEIVNTSIVREPASSGQSPCLSSSEGGFEIHGVDSNHNGTTTGSAPAVLATYGNVISGLSIEATGDDSLAFFDDIGGYVYLDESFPTSTVSTSTIDSPFVRAIQVSQWCGTLVSSSGTCTGPSVDSYTLSHITNCYLNPGNSPPSCPVNRGQ